MSSGDSDGPLLFQRGPLNNKAERSDSDSPLPDWLSQHTSPVKTLGMLSDSDDAVEVDADKGAHSNASKTAAVEGAGALRSAGHAGEQHAAEGLGNSMKGKRKAISTVLLSSDDDVSPLPKAPTRQGAARKKLENAGNASPLEPGPGQAVGLSIGLPDRGGPDLQQGASKAAEEAQLEETGLSSQQIKAGKQAAAKGVAALDARPGEIPIMLPDKLPNNKFIVELEADPYGSTDLTGDAGVVGRWLVEGDAEEGQELQLDLKGVLYTVNLVPCASTLCVVNLGAAEARVEALASEYMALRRRDGGASGAGGPAEDGRADAFMFADDDDNYLVQGGTQQGGGEHGGGPSGAKGKTKTKAGAGGAAKKPAAKRSAGAKPAGGVKKKPSAKPGAKGKGTK